MFGIKVTAFDKVIIKGVEELLKQYLRNDFIRGAVYCGNRDRKVV